MAMRLAPAATAPQAAPIPRIRPRASTALERIALVLVALWIPLQLLVTWPAPLAVALDGPWRFDPAIFLYEGALVREGGIPYVTFWDHKGPLIYLINAAGLALSSGRIWGVWVLGLLATWLAAAVGYRAMRESFGVAGALVGLVFFVVALGGIEAGANMTEQYALPLAWGAALVVVRWARTRRATVAVGFALGVLGGLAFFLRANLVGAAASAVLTLAVVLLLERRTGALVRPALGAALGATLVGGVILAWLARNGALRAFWDQAIMYNLLYAHAQGAQRLFAALAGLWLATATAPLVLPLVGLALCLRRLGQPGAGDRSDPLVLFVVIWISLELLLASVSGRPYDHYFMMLLPPMAMLTAALVAEGLRLVPARVRRSVRSPVLVAVVFALVMIRPVVDRAVARARTGELVPSPASSQVALAAAFVRANSAPTDRLLVWGLAGGVYFLADRPPASRYLFAFPLLTRSYGDSVAPRFLAELRRTPPKLIVDAAVSYPSTPTLARWDPSWRFPHIHWHAPYWAMTPSLRPFYDFVAQNYVPVAVVGPERWIVYRAKARSERP